MRLVRRLALTWLVASTVASSRANQSPHYVFAHYMVCFATYGETLAAYEREIREAQAVGIDGFALDVGAWSGPYTYYKTRVALLYNAAEDLGTDFKLFFSVDMPFTNDIVDMVSAYASRTNSFRYTGKLVLSTSGQNGVDWSNGVFQPLQSQGISVFFVPYFLPENGQGYDYVGISNLVSKYNGILDGLFYFAAGTADIITNRNAAYGQACKNAGKLFMAGYSPSYWGCNQPTAGRPYYETQGGEGTAAEWAWVIANQPDWVEIVTWNDFNESTYVSPVTDPGQYFDQLQSPRRYCHAGYLELTKRFIQWYKTGTASQIESDALYFFYRTHQKNAVASNTNDLPVSSLNGDVQDAIYATFYLKAAATVEITSGLLATTNSVASGMSHLRTAFSPGHQAFTVRRGGTNVFSVLGSDVLTNIQVYDFFPASGYAYSAPQSPKNLRVEQP